MAKLNGVKVIDMVGGKVTKVEYEGSMYTNFGAVEAKAGDLVTFHVDRRKTDAGGFYTVLEGDRYVANDGYTGYYTEGWGGKDRRDVYRKAEFREIEREYAEVGDFVKFRKDRGDYLIAGKMYEIDEIDGAGDPQIIDEEGDSFDTCGEDVTFYTKASKDDEVDEIDTKENVKVGDNVVISQCLRYDDAKEVGWGVMGQGLLPVGAVGEVVEVTSGGVYAKFTEPKPKAKFYLRNGEFEKAGEAKLLQVGDYARVTKDNYEHLEGDIVKITETLADSEYFDFKIEHVKDGGVGYIKAENVEKVDKEEALEEAKWAKIGRKPNEYKEGDIARITDYQCGHYVGTLVEVTGFGTTNLRVNGIYSGKLRDFYADVECIELVAPAEARF